MKPARTFALAVLTALALFAPPVAAGEEPAETMLSGIVTFYDGGVWIGAESDPAGWVLSNQAAPAWIGPNVIAYLDGADAGIDFKNYDGRVCVAHGVRYPDALSGGGVETGVRTFDLLKVDSIETDDVMPVPVRRRFPRLATRIVADMTQRGVLDFSGAAATPTGGLSLDGRIDGRRFARVVPLGIVAAIPEDPDPITDFAFVDVRSRRYWARRSGGGLEVSRWIGPFKLPRGRIVRAATVTNVRVSER